ncbi:pentapeptide repeat-containing protein [Mycobacterium simiae]|uniref:Pentapeptide repeat-containing protein n=1 Tax=Mycobacterium simiae TaxID=1784 RepID=A0A1X0XRP0_MYCSI|nr:pentapeptide repeat-containing protein [Mycobacterium simiae]ORJ55517.1 hypothetical protein B5M45_24420 [Mycobacterium simiae]
MNIPFLGKWALTTTYENAVVAVTLDPESEEMRTAAFVSPPSDEQRVNAYGWLDSLVGLQAGNGKYLVFTVEGIVPIWKAIGGEITNFWVVQKDDTFAFRNESNTVCFMAGFTDTLIGIFDYPDYGNMKFSCHVISPALADLVSAGGGSGLDLRWVSFAGADMAGIKLVRCDLSNADLSGAVLTKAVLSGLDLSTVTIDVNTVFTQAELDGANLSGKTLGGSFSGTNLRGAKLSKADFSKVHLDASTVVAGAQLDGANLSWQDLDNMDFSGANLSGANLTLASYRHTNFTGAVLSGVDLTDALDGSVFTKAKLDGADLNNQGIDNLDFSYADLRGADLNLVRARGTNFTGADLSGIDLTSMRLDASTLFAQATLRGAKLTGMNIDTMNFSGANLSEANLDGVSAVGTNLAGADLSGVDLTHVIFDPTTIVTQAKLDGANLTGLKLDTMNFSGASLVGANLDQVSARSANFTGADLSKVSALAAGEGVSFAGSDLSNAKLADATLEGARFSAEDGLPAAVLAGAYMPNADLTSANLVSVDMSGVQWYGANAKADGADLRNVNLAKANLATMDLSQVKMDGAVLSYASLINTNLRGASLTRDDENQAVSLAFASLQGADLTGATLPGADLTNAAVALSIPGPAKTFVGVPLFPIDISLVSDLDQGHLSDNLQQAFSNSGYPLIPTATITVVEPRQQWSIDNYDTSGGSGLQATYGTFSLVLPSQPGAVRVYGSPPLLVIAYNADNEQIQLAPTFAETVDLTDAIDDEATCPNGMRWAEREHGVDVETLMTAATPPHPPKCVPSETNWCPSAAWAE